MTANQPSESAPSPAFVLPSAEAEAAQIAAPPRRPISKVAGLIWLLGTAGILAIACLMTVGSDRQVLLPGLDRPIPETCAMHTRFGIDCPGCGLTRSFIHLAHGDVQSAWRLNPASLLVFAFVASQIPLALAHLLAVPGRFFSTWTWWNERALILLLIVLFVQWLWRLMTGDLF